VQYVIGGRFACLACMRRGVRAECGRCAAGGNVVDLETDDGRRKLLARQAEGHFHAERGSFWDPRPLRNQPAGRWALWLGTRLSFVAGAALAWLRLGVRAEIRVFFAALAGVAAAGLWLGLLAVTVLAALGTAGVLAQVLELIALGLGALARVAPAPVAAWASRARLRTTALAGMGVMRVALHLVERAFVPRLRTEEVSVAVDAPYLEGVIRSECTPLVLLAERAGSPELCDASVVPFELETRDGRRVWVELLAGVVDADAPRGRADEVLAPALPSWCERERLASATVARIAAGTRVAIEGGRWVEQVERAGTGAGFRTALVRRVLRGDGDAPASLRVVSE
jgi:hypothetical protein